MTRRGYANLLARTYYHRVTAFRPTPEGGARQICREAPCALSRSAHTSAPTPPDGTAVLPEALYRLTLFTRPELWFRLGDLLEITDTAGRVYRAKASDSVCYQSHCVTVAEIEAVFDQEEVQA